ncbi:MAG TPA: single-stranded DNA-binding protein [Planctomycetia bacterium]|jgi:single-strand DNA-binding protein|nr:single-stranded DNA-binding protein [Planctomycetia bacterium]
MADLNKVLLIGRLTRDPEVRFTPSGMAIADIGLAVNKRRKAQDGSWQEETAFINCTAFGRTAELAQQYLKKGRQVFVEGSLRFDQWEDKNTGQKRSKLDVTIDNLQFLDGGPGRREDGGGDQGAGGEAGSAGDSRTRGGGGYGGGPGRGDEGGGGNFGGGGRGDADIPF